MFTNQTIKIFTVFRINLLSVVHTSKTITFSRAYIAITKLWHIHDETQVSQTQSAVSIFGKTMKTNMLRGKPKDCLGNRKFHVVRIF